MPAWVWRRTEVLAFWRDFCYKPLRKWICLLGCVAASAYADSDELLLGKPSYRRSSFHFVLEVDTSTLQCVEAWPGPRGLYGRLYSYFIFITGFALPLTVLFGCYLKICLELRRNSASNQNHALRADHDREAEKVLKMSIVVTVVFSVCTLPNHIVWLALDFDELNCAQCHPWLIVANIFVFANSAANPVVCTIFNEKYRCEFKKLFKRKRKRDRNQRGHNKGTALEEQL
ncbi:galanin receptor type 1-like [Acropora millepora]|uniref:galanin receptor type 1-like n=1 Tax=Acropora millepora TaxID=45264 RepID=UPI0010FCDB0E|nr:galanin receptor type 1-like [Acropora millepora]